MNLPYKFVRFALWILAENKRRTFISACKAPQKYQDNLLKKILKRTTIPFPEASKDYRDYDENQTTSEKINFFETTSGSTGTKKRIPYTRPLLRAFENMFLLWAHDVVFHSGLGLKSGKFFMSVSPRIGASSTDDRKYLSPILRFLLLPFLVSDPDQHQAETGKDFFLKISKDLLRHRDLEIISIWSPTYFLSLLNFMEEHRKELNLPTLDWSLLWPRLKLISCWTHAQAERSAEALQNKFPKVHIQPKGLLLTEAPVTIPWTEAQGNIPLVTETYLEFLQGETIYALHEVKIGERYIVLTSQFNGYLRYNTQDEVEVTGFYFATPILRFIGRSGTACDLAGEKLNELLLREIFSDVQGQYLIVPDLSSELPYYQVFTEESEFLWEERLRTIHHYDLARTLNQLSPLKISTVKDVGDLYLRFCQSEGMILGDIKERILFSDLKQAGRFLAWIERELPPSHEWIKV